MSIGLIGCDKRYQFLSENLNYDVDALGNDKIKGSRPYSNDSDLKDYLSCHRMVIVPIPFTKNQLTLNMPFSHQEIALNTFYSFLNHQHILIGGPFNEGVIKKSKAIGFKLMDITTIDSFKEYNAIPTAEGVVAKLVEASDDILYNSRALVLGFGYCGKRLAKVLSAFGVEIYVYTKNEIESYDIIKNKYKGYQESDSIRIPYIINTIPVKTLPLHTYEKELMIDITNAYDVFDSKVMKMRGIPGRIAPKYSGKMISFIINEMIKNIFLEELC